MQATQAKVQHYYLKIPGVMLSWTLLQDGQLRPIPMVSVLERVDCSLHFGRKFARIFVLGHQLSVPRSSKFPSSSALGKLFAFGNKEYPSIFSHQMD